MCKAVPWDGNSNSVWKWSHCYWFSLHSNTCFFFCTVHHSQFEKPRCSPICRLGVLFSKTKASRFLLSPFTHLGSWQEPPCRTFTLSYIRLHFLLASCYCKTIASYQTMLSFPCCLLLQSMCKWCYASVIKIMSCGADANCWYTELTCSFSVLILFCFAVGHNPVFLG